MTPRPRARLLPALAGLLAVVALVTGCSEPFEPQGEEARSARSAALDQVDSTLADVGGGTPSARARFDQCASGQDNWKRRDEHAHECTLAVAGLFPLARRRADVSRALVALHDDVTSLGCTARDDDLLTIERDYWRERARATELPSVGLPGARYVCGDVELEIQPLPPEAGEGYRRMALEPDTMLSAYAPDEVLVDEPFPPEALEVVEEAGDATLVVVTASCMYYATDF